MTTQKINDDQTIDELRAEYRRIRAAADYAVGRQAFDAYMGRSLPDNPTPEDFVATARNCQCECDRCKGSGQYGWGACVNGKMTNSGPCFRCQGTGKQFVEDFYRNRAYDRYAIVRAFREMC